MEKKQRVKEGEAYYSIFLFGGGYSIIEMTEGSGYPLNFEKQSFEFNNYFSTKESAEQMARKLRAVLAGADVIEMPTAKETLKMMPDGIFTGWEKCYEFLKSKIVK